MIRTQPEKSTWVNIWEERVRAKTLKEKMKISYLIKSPFVVVQNLPFFSSIVFLVLDQY